MTEPTKGLRLAFEPGICGLKFVSEEKPYPEANGPDDMAYINRLIEADERKHHLEALDRYMAGYMRFTTDGKLEHVPWDEMRKSDDHT
jgi:hypothetical protein